MEESTEHLRLFVALPAPDEVRQKIAAAQEVLKAAIPRQCARWTSPEQFHLTLRFLGNVEARRVNELAAALGSIAGQAARFTLRAQGIGFFPNAKNPRVIWVGVREESDAFEALWRRVQDATDPFTSEESGPGFKGHLTIGRIKFLNPPDRRRLIEPAGRLADGCFGEWSADHFQLVRSQLSSTGAQHACLVRFPFAA